MMSSQEEGHNTNTIEARSYVPARDGFRQQDTKIPKSMRIRYWNSWEEMKLIELWRRHCDEIVTLDKSMPVFRTIAEEMRDAGLNVNSTECRRKINTIKNKYIAERRRIENSDSYPKSEWKLYPLVHCLLQPKIKNANLKHELEVVSNLTADIHIPAKRIDSAAAISPFYKNTKIMLTTNHLPASSMGHHTTASSAGHLYQTLPTINKRNNNNNDGSGFILRHHFTKARLDELRINNLRLSERRDIESKRLQVEETEFKTLETFLAQWQLKHEQMLQQLEVGK